MAKEQQAPKFRRAPPTVRREALIEATLACLRKYGHDGLSVRRIGAEAGVSPGLITHHFPSVSALIAASYETLSMSLLHSIEQHAREPDSSPRERLRRFYEAWFAPAQVDPGLFNTWLVFWSMISHDAGVRAVHDRTYAAYRAALESSSASCSGPRRRDSGCVRRQSRSRRCSMGCGRRPVSIRARSSPPRRSPSAKTGPTPCAQAPCRAFSSSAGPSRSAAGRAKCASRCSAARMIPGAKRWFGTRIRWRIFAFLFGFGLIAYVQRTGVTIAAERMMPELHLSQLQIGWIEQAFVVGYCLFQLPSGLFGQRFGARTAFTVFGIVAFAAMMATPAAPEALSGPALFVVLLGAQFVLGVAQAGTFPVSNGVFEAWFPARQWALVQGAQNMGLNLGAALTPPLVAVLMTALGWQQALAWSALPAVLLVGLWAWYARNTPREHPAVAAAELAELGEVPQVTVADKITVRRLLRLLGHRNTALLALSYLAMNYSFYLLANWCFLYLIQQRHFSVLQSGWLAMAPPIAAGVGSGVGGVLTGRLCERYGAAWGYRGVPLVALPLVGVLLLIAVRAANAYVAVAALTACFGFVEINEAAYWAASMTIGRSDSMAVGGVLNTGGTLGGIIGIPVVAYLSGRGAWNAAFAIGSVCAVAAALLWLGVNADRTVIAATHTAGAKRPTLA